MAPSLVDAKALKRRANSRHHGSREPAFCGIGRDGARFESLANPRNGRFLKSSRPRLLTRLPERCALLTRNFRLTDATQKLTLSAATVVEPERFREKDFAVP
jgi:hypothetical protein